MRSFSELLVHYTERAGISDSELARATGVQRQTIFRWKEGQTARPRYREDVVRIAAKLRLTSGERDELLLAAGFPPQEAPVASATQPDDSALPLPGASVPAVAPTPADSPTVGHSSTVSNAADPDTTSGATHGEPSPTSVVQPQPSSAHPSSARPPRLFPNPALLLGVAAAVMLAVALAGYFVLPLIFGPRTVVTPTAVPVAITVPSPTPAVPTPTVTPIVAAAGEKLLLVAPFVGYTSEELRFNVAGRIEEALQREIVDSSLRNVRVAVLPSPVTAQVQARSVLSETGGSALIWGEYDAGRVRANVTIPGEDERNLINAVDSPDKLAVVINDAVPNAARILGLFSLGRLYRQDQDLPLALRTFEKALALKPADAAMLASLHFYIGNLLPKVKGLKAVVLTEAIGHYNAALEYKPDWDYLWYNRGTNYLGRALLSLEEEADLEAAIADLTTVLQRQPRSVDALINRGIAYYQRRSGGDLEAAIDDFTRAIELAPDDYRPYYHRGLAHIRRGADTTWSADMLRAVALQPGNPALSNGLCWGYALDGRAEEALPHCETAVAGDATGSSFDGRAIAYGQLGRYAEAASDLKQYLLWVQAEYPDLYDKYRGPAVEEWIAALEAGENPFTSDIRAGLR
jgi:tetratricopeptide (TPR) repeat protein